MLQKIISFTFALLLVLFVISIWKFPAATPIDSGYAVLVPEDTTLYIGPAAGRDGMFIGNSIQIYAPDIYTVGEVLGQWNIPTWETNPSTLIPKIK